MAAAAGMAVFALRPRRRFDFAGGRARALGPQDAGRLVESLEYGNRHTRPATRRALTSILSDFTVEHRGLLSARHWTCLYAELDDCNARRERDADYARAILHAIEQAGSAAALPRVDYLADLDRPALRTSGVQDAARACVAALRARAAAERTAATLLRAASSPAADMLVRAAGATQEDPAQLLRAAQPGADAPDA